MHLTICPLRSLAIKHSLTAIYTLPEIVHWRYLPSYKNFLWFWSVDDVFIAYCHIKYLAI